MTAWSWHHSDGTCNVFNKILFKLMSRVYHCECTFYMFTLEIVNVYVNMFCSKWTLFTMAGHLCLIDYEAEFSWGVDIHLDGLN